jgi:hypothetical protein
MTTTALVELESIDLELKSLPVIALQVHMWLALLQNQLIYLGCSCLSSAPACRHVFLITLILMALQYYLGSFTLLQTASIDPRIGARCDIR